MKKSDEILNLINDKKAEIEALKAENKIEEALALVEEIKNLKADYEVEKTLEDTEILNSKGVDFNMNKKYTDEQIKKDEDLFINYVRAVKNDLKAGANGAVIPETIADRIIMRVYEISPFLERVTRFNEKGTLIFPVEGEASLLVGFQQEFVEMTAKDPAITTVQLDSHIIGALTKISKSLINRAGFDVVSFVVDAIARDLAKFLEDEIFNATSTKIVGISEATEVSGTKANVLDALIDALVKVPSRYQDGAMYVMNAQTLADIRKIKKDNGLLFNEDPTSPFVATIFGKPVYVSENVQADEIIFGNPRGVYMNVVKDVEIATLNEKYATQYAIGVCMYMEADAKLVEKNAVVKIKLTV